MPGARMFKIVVMKLIAPMIDAPAMCRAKIANETPTSYRAIASPTAADKGPARTGTPADDGHQQPMTSAGTSSQKEMLFMRGKAISGAPIISGTNQLPKPPISAGMTTKKIMITP